MDGVTFLRKIMSLRPMPVVMISTLTQAGADTTLEALEIGAVDFIAKPTHDVAAAMAAIAHELQVESEGRRARPRWRSFADVGNGEADAARMDRRQRQDYRHRSFHRRR